MASTDAEYDLFGERRDRLASCVEQAQAQFDALGMSQKSKIAEDLSSRLRSNQFRVLVVGEFKRGKSTFINALLSEEVLPAFATPCTAVINEVKWGPERRAVLHFREELPDPLPAGLPEPVRAHLAAAERAKPMTIGIEDLEDYVVIPDPTKDQAASVAESPYRCVEIFWPLELCRSGVEVVDSPGLNEHGTRTRVTTDYLTSVDAVLFVMSCQALASQSELSVIEHQIRRAGHEEIFFIANRFDEIRERERDRVMSYGRAKLGPLTALGEAGVFFLSSLDALDGRLDGDEEQVERSGILHLERRLAEFLTTDRGRVKLLRPARELIYGLREAKSEVIPQKLAMLNMGLEELQSRYEQVKPGLKDAEERRRQIVEGINQQRELLKREVFIATSSQLRELAKAIPDWAERYQTKTTFSVLKLSSKPQIEAIAAEVGTYLAERIEQEQERWQAEVLEPLLAKWMEELEERMRGRVAEFLASLDRISSMLSGTAAGRARTDEDEITPMERILAAAGGFLIGGAGAAVVGGTMGFKEMLKSLGPQIALVVSMILLGLSNPLVLIPVLLGGSAVQGFLKQGAVTAKIKSEVARELADSLRESAREQAEAVADEVFKQTEALVDTIAAGLDAEIATRREQVEAAIAELRAGAESVRVRRAEVEAVARTVDRIQSEVTDLVFELHP